MLINRSVLVHSCRIQPDGRTRDFLVAGEHYVGELGVSLAEQEWYYPLPKSCRCRRRVTSAEATEFVDCGWAVWLLKVKKSSIIPDEKRIWMPVVRERVPRVDLISRADIERAFIGSEKQSIHYAYNRTTQKFEVIKAIPEDMTEKEWLEDARKEIEFEQRIRRQYKKYIEGCHDITMQFRAKLIAPFRPDPFEGRVLFSFNSDQRTCGGHE